MRPTDLKAWIGYGVGAVCLAWLFYDVEWGRMLRGFARIRWGWAALGILLQILSYVCQGWRWELALRPAGKLQAMRATQAIYAGLFVNYVLPMRFGEVLRIWLVARWVRVEFAAILPSIVVERFFDGLWLALCMAIAAMFVPLPPNLLGAANILGIAITALTAILVYIVLRQPRGMRSIRYLGTIADGLRKIGRSQTLWPCLAVSLLFLVIQTAAYWLVMWGYGLTFSFWTGAVVFLIVHLGTVVPLAPANIGTYQLFSVIGLGMFGIEKTLAAGFSVVVFFLLTFPLALLGSAALSRSGMTLGSAREVLDQRGTASA